VHRNATLRHEGSKLFIRFTRGTANRSRWWLYKNAWGEDRVYFYNEDQQLTVIPANWTNVVAIDPVVTIAAGQAPFRANDLLEIARMIHSLSRKSANDV